MIGAHMVDNASDSVYNVDAVRHGAAVMESQSIWGTCPLIVAAITGHCGRVPILEAKVRIADIRIGERHRKDMGDIEGLARSIDEIGLLHPVVVRPDGTLVAGERRIKACLLLGWQDIPVTVIDLDAIVRGECDENQKRKDWTPTEAVAIAKALEPLEREAARDRYDATRPGVDVKFTPTERGAAMDKVADAVGMSRPTLTKAQEVIRAAEVPA